MADSSGLSHSCEWMAMRLFKHLYKWIVGNGNTHRFHYFMSSYQYTSCLIFNCFHSTTQRKEDACFLFLQVQPFKYGIAYPFRSVWTDVESESDNHFKAVNIHATFVRQMDIPLYFMLFQYSAFINGSDCSTDGRSDNPEQADKLRFTHSYIPVRYNHSTVFCDFDYVPLHCPAIDTLLNDWFSLLPNMVRSLSNFWVVILA